MENNLNFNEDLAIDLDDLHIEWGVHAGIRYKYACEISLLDKKIKQTKKLLDVTESKLIKKANQDPEKHLNVKKATVALVNAFCKEDKEYDKISDDLIENEYNLSMAKNAVNAFDNRKNALENEVKLYLNNYFATPREERQIEAGKSIVDANRQRGEIKQREKLNKSAKGSKGAKSETKSETKTNESNKPIRRRREK